jgi:basic membrane protein A
MRMSGLARSKWRGTLVALTAAVIGVVFVFAAAGSTAKTLKIGAALIGPKNDKSFSQAGYDGIRLAVKQNVGKLKLTSVLENQATDRQRTQAVDTLAQLNDIVVGVSSSFGPIFDAEATKFPTKSFIQIGGNGARYHKNVYAFSNDAGAPVFVAGAIAAAISKSGVVGYVGGYEIPPTTQAAAGFRHGAQLINPKIKVLSNIIGDFNDVAKAKQATAAMIADGADVIFPFLDAGIAGSYQAGKESGKNPAMFKLTTPNCTAYDNIVGTEIINNVAATSRMLGALVKGTLKPGAIFLGLSDPQIQTLQLCPKYKKTAKVAAVSKRIIAGLNSGKIKLPADSINARPKYPYREGFNGKVINASKTG